MGPDSTHQDEIGMFSELIDKGEPTIILVGASDDLKLSLIAKLRESGETCEIIAVDSVGDALNNHPDIDIKEIVLPYTKMDAYVEAPRIKEPKYNCFGKQKRR
jgi:hypothetical protein